MHRGNDAQLPESCCTRFNRKAALRVRVGPRPAVGTWGQISTPADPHLLPGQGSLQQVCWELWGAGNRELGVPSDGRCDFRLSRERSGSLRVTLGCLVCDQGDGDSDESAVLGKVAEEDRWAPSDVLWGKGPVHTPQTRACLEEGRRPGQCRCGRLPARAPAGPALWGRNQSSGRVLHHHREIRVYVEVGPRDFMTCERSLPLAGTGHFGTRLIR